MNNCLLIKLKKSSTKLTVGQLTADRLPTRTRRNGQQPTDNRRQTTFKHLASLIQTKYDRETAEETTHNLHF